MSSPADTLFFGGTILTIDPDRPMAQALAVRDGRILALGTKEELQALVGTDTAQIDLHGQTLLPGFVEAHAHPFGYGRIWGEPLVNIRASHIPSYEAVIATIKRRVAKAAPGEVLAFVGLDALRHEGMREPTLAELDAYAPDNPLAVYTFNFHSLFINSKMMALLGLDALTQDMPGGRYERDSQGQLTGKMIELAAFKGFAHICEQFGSERGLRELSGGLWKFAKDGITTVADAGPHDGAIPAYKKLLEQEGMPIRLRLYARVAFDGPSAQTLDWGGDDVQMIGVKVWADGSPFVGTAWLSRPYLNSEVTLKGMSLSQDYVGHMNYEFEQLHDLIDRHASQGWQIATHAQGDKTIDAVLDIYDTVLKKYNHTGSPFRLEHCGTMRDDQIARAHAMGVVCSFFVAHVYHWGDPIRDALLGPERAGNYMPIGSASRAGMRISYHSDAPMTEPDPLLSIQTAVTRLTATGEVLGAHQRVSIDDALRAMTIDAAYHIGMEHEVGCGGQVKSDTTLSCLFRHVTRIEQVRCIPRWSASGYSYRTQR
ncbi:amidohydrolase, partial [Alcaligenaceae bacterium]|nr:amidohydrolase [Alcaligenaceae bacterium]